MALLTLTEACQGDCSRMKPILILNRHDQAGGLLLPTLVPAVLVELLRGRKPWQVELLENYLQLERDNFARELAHLIADKVRQVLSGVPVQVLDVNFPRGLIDANRKFGHDGVYPVRRSFDFAQKPELHGEFVRYHDVIVDKVREQVSNCALFLDVHTMNAYDLIRPHDDVSDPDLDPYVRMYRGMTNWGEKRKVNLVDSTPEGELLADRTLVEKVLRIFEGEGVETSRNHPYKVNPFITLGDLYPIAPGLAVDVPLHELTLPGQCDPVAPVLDRKKLDRIAHLLAQPVIATYNSQTPAVL